MGIENFRLLRPFIVVVALAVCIGAAVPARPAPTDGKTTADSKWTTLHFANPVVFAIGMDSDIGTNSRIAIALASRLYENGKGNPSQPVHGAWVVPGGTMTVADFVDQCSKDSNTRGAFIVLPTAVANSNDNGIILIRNNTEVFLNVMAAGCDHSASAAGVSSERSPSPAPSGSASIVWASSTEHGVKVRTQVEFFPIAILTSIYFAFAPQRTTQTTTTTVFPTTTPIPPTGARASVQQQNSTVLNASGTASLQGGVLNAFAGNGVGTSIGAVNSPEKQTYHAVDDAIGYIVKKQINAACQVPSGGAAAPAFCSW